MLLITINRDSIVMVYQFYQLKFRFCRLTALILHKQNVVLISIMSTLVKKLQVVVVQINQTLWYINSSLHDKFRIKLIHHSFQKAEITLLSLRVSVYTDYKLHMPLEVKKKIWNLGYVNQGLHFRRLRKLEELGSFNEMIIKYDHDYDDDEDDGQYNLTVQILKKKQVRQIANNFFNIKQPDADISFIV